MLLLGICGTVDLRQQNSSMCRIANNNHFDNKIISKRTYINYFSRGWISDVSEFLNKEQQLSLSM